MVLFTLEKVVLRNVDERQADERQVRDIKLVVARRHAALLIVKSEHAFNLVVFHVDCLVVFPRLHAIRLRRHDRGVTAVRQQLTPAIVLVGAVHHQEIDARSVRSEQLKTHRRSVSVAGGKSEAQRMTNTRRHQINLRRQPTRDRPIACRPSFQARPRRACAPAPSCCPTCPPSAPTAACPCPASP